MSRHHVGQHWTTFARKRRAELAAQLPLPCIDPRCLRGGTVLPDPPNRVGPTGWHVGHRQDAAKGGRPTRENTGPIHVECNLRHRAGIAVNGRVRPSKATGAVERGLRPW